VQEGGVCPGLAERPPRWLGVGHGPGYSPVCGHRAASDRWPIRRRLPAVTAPTGRWPGQL